VGNKCACPYSVKHVFIKDGGNSQDRFEKGNTSYEVSMGVQLEENVLFYLGTSMTTKEVMQSMNKIYPYLSAATKTKPKWLLDIHVESYSYMTSKELLVLAETSFL
jgi:hypothetical protein